MKNLILVLSVIALLAGVSYGQGAAPAPPSPIKRVGTNIENTSPFITQRWIVGELGTYDTLGFWYFGGFKYLKPFDDVPSRWNLGALGQEWDNLYVDTVRIASTVGRLRIDGDYFYRLDGEGLEASGGLSSELRAVLGRDISSPEIVDTTIQPADMSDTATTWTLAALYLDSVHATREVMHKRYVDTTLGGLPTSIVPEDSATFNDDYVVAWDSAANSFYLKADAGSAGGDNIGVDTGDGNRVDGTDWLLRGAVSIEGDTISFAGGIDSAVSTIGDTVGSSSTIYDWSQSDLEDIDRLSADTIKASRISFPTAGGSIDSVASVLGIPNSSLALYSPGTAPTGWWVYNDYGVFFNEGATQKLNINGDTLKGMASGGNIMRGFKSVATDSITVGSVVLGGYVSGVLNPAMAARNVRDSLANYVLKANENWLDISSDASIRHYSGLNATDELIRMTRTLNGDDTTTQTVLTGNFKLESPLSVSIIGGPGNPTLDDTLNMNGYNIYGISRAEGDTADFTTYLNVPGLEGMTDSIAAVRTDLDSLNTDVAANYATTAAVSALINDSSVVHKWIPLNLVSSWVKPLEDSVYLMDNVVLDRASASPEQYVVLDSAGDIDVSGGSRLDTFFLVGTLPEMGVIDSIQYTYKVSGAGVNIDTVDLWGPTRGDLGINQCDSVYFGEGTNRTSTSLARIRYELTNPITATTAGQRFAIRFVVTLNADNSWVAIGYAQLGYK